MISDSHLEQALADYNDRISKLEAVHSVEDLLEAYINRGTVLMMMESYVAAMSDFDEAVELIEEMEYAGDPPDLGLFIRAYENRGQLCCGDDDAQMVSDYARIAEKLPILRHGTRYFQTKDIVQMCINCAEDLLDEGYWENALPFLEKGRDMLEGKYDPWSQNRLAEIQSLFGEAYEGMGLHNSAEHHLTDAIVIEMSLFERRTLEDRFQLVLDLVSRGDVREHSRDVMGSIEDHAKAADILEGNSQMFPMPTAEPIHASLNPHRDRKLSRRCCSISKSLSFLLMSARHRAPRSRSSRSSSSTARSR